MCSFIREGWNGGKIHALVYDYNIAIFHLTLKAELK